MELETVWSGSDRDVYLCVPLAPRIAPIEASRLSPAIRQQVADVIPMTQAEAVTNAEIIAKSGATYGVVATALYRLRAKGVLRWELVPGRVGSGQRPRRYWRVSR